MEYRIQHEEFTNIVFKDDGQLFNTMFSFSTFREVSKYINTITKKYIEYGYTEEIIEDDIKLGQLKFKGDLFEIFAEIFLYCHRSDNRIGIHEYKTVYDEDDNGVDGYGKNINGDNLTVQVKFRTNPTAELKERDIKQFGYQSLVKYGVEPLKQNNMVIFTNCKGLHWYTRTNIFNDKLTVINGEFISDLIDNNQAFWNTSRNVIQSNLF